MYMTFDTVYVNHTPESREAEYALLSNFLYSRYLDKDADIIN